MSGSKRQRDLARAKYERQQARRTHNVNKRRRNQRIVAVVVVVALVLGSVAWVILANTSSEGTAAAAPAASDPAVGEPAVLDCTAPGTPRANDMVYPTPTPGGTGASITFTTNCGDIVVALDAAAPLTVASEVFLTEQGFYDNTQCHRLTTDGIYVLQCGDPAGDGTGGPGYAVSDENLPAEGAANYPAGTVAMANAGPGTSGSQFFIAYADTTLPGDYTIWGTVTSGLDIVQEIASVGVADGGADGTPRQPVFIESATVQPK